MTNDLMKFENSRFLPSTIREDSGVEGAILVDSVLIREAELPYGNTTNFIPKESISDENFVNSLKGLLIFKEHPDVFVNSVNYEKLARESIGTIVDAKYQEKNGERLVVGTLRIVNTDAIESISNKEINGGSLGYYANSDNDCGKIVQRNLRPNHFCITYTPRDEGVQIFNSIKGGQMTEVDIKNIVVEALAESRKVQNSNDIVIDKAKFNGFFQALGNRIADKKVVEVLNSKEGMDKFDFIDSVMCVSNIFQNSEDEASETENCDEAKDDEKEELKKENEELKKENSALKEALEKKNSDDESEAENSDDEEKENEDDSKEEENESDESDKKENSAPIVGEVAEVKNSVDSHLNDVLNSIL